MKKILAVLLAISICFALVACNKPEQTPESESASTPPSPELPKIGLSLGKGDAFELLLAEHAKQAAQQQGYELVVMNAKADADQQEKDITELSSLGVESVMISPADKDTLDSAIQQLDSLEIKVINLVEPINATLPTLICPDYSKIGKSAAELAHKASKTGVYLLEMDIRSSIMQLIHDGFKEKADALKLKIVNATNFSYAQQSTLEGFSLKDIGQADTVFCQSSEMAAKLQATLPKDSSIKIITITSDPKQIAEAGKGSIYGCVAIDAQEFAKTAVEQAVKCAKDASYTPKSFIEIPAQTVSADTKADK